MSAVKIITPLCTVCGQHGLLTVDEDGYRRWQDGDLIQNALPRMPKEQREQLLTGTHPQCWKKLFGETEVYKGEQL